MDNIAFLKGLYDAFGRGEIPTVLAAMSPDIHWHQAENNPYRLNGEPWVGPDSILNELFIRLGTEWDNFTIHPKSFHNAGDNVIVEVRYSGTYKATGKSMDAQSCHVWNLKDGKVARFQQYADTAQFHEVMKT